MRLQPGERSVIHHILSNTGSTGIMAGLKGASGAVFHNLKLAPAIAENTGAATSPA
jgi:hypothetical protein